MGVSYKKHKNVTLVSFPKTGRTWLRLMLGKLIGTNPSNLFDLPYIHITHDNDPHEKTTDEIKFNNAHKDNRVIFLIRDPRDVVVSLYFHKTKRQLLDVGDIDSYIRSDKGSLRSLIKFYNVWAENTPKDFLMISYEDLHLDGVGTLRRVAEFIGLNPTNEELANAVDFSSFENMRMYEKRGDLNDEIWGCHVLTPKDFNDLESYKTRRGKVGGYTDYLDKLTCTYMNELIENLDDSYNIFKSRMFL